MIEDNSIVGKIQRILPFIVIPLVLWFGIIKLLIDNGII